MTTDFSGFLPGMQDKSEAELRHIATMPDNLGGNGMDRAEAATELSRRELEAAERLADKQARTAQFAAWAAWAGAVASIASVAVAALQLFRHQ